MQLTTFKNRIRSHMSRLAWAGCIAFGMAATMATPAAFAHPMGNFSVNHYSHIALKSDHVEVTYLVDIAEIPTYQELRAAGLQAAPDDPKVKDYAVRRAESLRDGLRLGLDGNSLPLRLLSHSILFPEGAGGLPTMKIGLLLTARLPTGKSATLARLHFADNNFPGRAGWKEIIASGDGLKLDSSSVPDHDRSAGLTNYPTDLLNSPPQVLDATLSFTMPALTPTAPVRTATTTNQVTANPVTANQPSVTKTAANGTVGHSPDAHSSGAAITSTNVANQVGNPAAVAPTSPAAVASSATPAVALQPNQQATPRSAFTELIKAPKLGFWFLFTAAFIAAGLGALHALEPGHGKTIVASYLVGSRGKPRHAVFLGLIVTAAHTAGVYVLGAITLYASRYIVPEQLYPWLGAISGLTITVLAVVLLLRRWTGASLDHDHTPGQMHSHWNFFLALKSQSQSPEQQTQLASGKSAADAPVSLRQLLILGVTGGMIPCPAALVVLLSAVSLHRTSLGLFLIIAFSGGLAAVLISIGLLMVSAGKAVAKLGPRFDSQSPLITRWLPLFSSAVMAAIGLGITWQALASTSIVAEFGAAFQSTSFVVVALLGLFLGMRHSTDPDHVVAVSTIVAKQGRISSAVMVGALWGIGHTVTIFVVGSAIILFGVVIPPRVGLGMEFSVALMLILLGVLNLTGVMKKVTARFTPGGLAAAEFTKSGSVEPNLSLDAGSGANASARLFTTSSAMALGSDLPTRATYFNKLLDRLGAFQLLRPLLIGTVHGLAGSAAVALLVLSTIKSATWAIAYLLIFGLGTVFGMMLITLIIAMPFIYTERRFSSLNRHLATASGLASFGFGLFLVYHLGFVDGLFSAHPNWTPQ